MRDETDRNGALETKWSGRWDQFKGKVKETWGHLTDDDLDVAEGEFEQMIGRIKERTGETEDNIRRRLDH